MSTNSERIVSTGTWPVAAHPLYDIAATRRLEHRHGSLAGKDSLMALAGKATARLALAIAPHARDIWVACGPGNNGGDGFRAALQLKLIGKNPLISYLPGPEASADALAARSAAQQMDLSITTDMPPSFDMAIDAMFGIGALRPFSEAHARWISGMNSSGVALLAVDVPSGLNADTGSAQALHVRATHTLSLLTMKPGLFTAHGRDACGEIWFNSLGIAAAESATARLIGVPLVHGPQHSSHKGSHGDVVVVGGAQGMLGAALLAGRAALHGGAGRVMVCLLAASQEHYDADQPELMFREPTAIDWHTATGVVGCGGGTAIGLHLPEILRNAQKLVLDADALNCIAAHPELQALLATRSAATTVITPHPLEAARLLQRTASAVQSNRLGAAQALVQQFNCTVVLKGSGTIVASPDELPRVNTTGNGLLATAGTGDVLAGLIGARLANGLGTLEAACESVYLHGQVASGWPQSKLTASALAKSLGR